MAMGIPLPQNNRSGLFEGMLAGHKRRDAMEQANQQMQQQQAQLQQQWQQHLENLAIKKQQEQRLGEAATREAELHPWQQLFAQTRATNEGLKYSPEKQKLETDAIRAKIAELKTRAEKNQRPPSDAYKPSELERIAKAMSNGDPEKEKAILAEGGATKYGLTLPGAEKLPVGSQPFKSLPKNLQAQENADQIKMQTRVNDSKKAYHDLDEMEKIINANPNMAREFAYIIGNPEDKSFISNLSRRYVDRNKLAAIEKFVKYSNDFVLSAGGGLGNNFTDAKLKALQLSKMHAGNTDEANRSIINNYRTRLKPLINYGAELKKARGKYTLPYFEDSYTDEAILANMTDEELAELEKNAK